MVKQEIARGNGTERTPGFGLRHASLEDVLALSEEPVTDRRLIEHRYEVEDTIHTAEGGLWIVSLRTGGLPDGTHKRVLSLSHTISDTEKPVETMGVVTACDNAGDPVSETIRLQAVAYEDQADEGDEAVAYEDQADEGDEPVPHLAWVAYPSRLGGRGVGLGSRRSYIQLEQSPESNLAPDAYFALADNELGAIGMYGYHEVPAKINVAATSAMFSARLGAGKFWGQDLVRHNEPQE